MVNPTQSPVWIPCFVPRQLPLSLLKAAQGQPMLVELKNGDTYNGRLDNCDSWMNIKLKDVIFTSRVRFDTRVATRYGCCQSLSWVAITADRHELGDSPQPSGIMVSKIRGLLFSEESNGPLLYAVARGHPW